MMSKNESSEDFNQDIFMKEHLKYLGQDVGGYKQSYNKVE